MNRNRVDLNGMKLECVNDDEKYASKEGWILQREHGETPNGNDLNGQWVLRSPEGEMIDFNRYRNDMAGLHNFELVGYGQS